MFTAWFRFWRKSILNNCYRAKNVTVTARSNSSYAVIAVAGKVPWITYPVITLWEYRMVPRKTLVSQNFGPISKSRKPFWCVSKSRFRVISESWFFFYAGRSLGFVVFSFRLVFRIRLFQRSWVELIELSWQIIKTVFHRHFRSFSLVLFVPLSRNFRRLESWAQNW